MGRFLRPVYIDKSTLPSIKAVINQRTPDGKPLAQNGTSVTAQWQTKMYLIESYTVHINGSIEAATSCEDRSKQSSRYSLPEYTATAVHSG